MDVDQLLQDRRVAQDHVVRQEDCAGLTTHQPPRRPDRVAKAEWPLLLDVRDVDPVGERVEAGQHLQEVVLAPVAQVELQLQVAVEVVHDRPLAAPGHHDDLFDSRGGRLLHPVLDGGLVD